MFEWVTHLTGVALGALVSAGALSIWRQRRGAAAADPAEHDLRVELNLATEAAGIGTWRMDIATGRTLADTALQRILGVGSEGIGRRLVYPADVERTQQAIRRAIETDATVALRTRIVRPDGQVRHLQIHFRRRRSATVTDPKQGELVGVSRDVTDEVERVEQQRVLSDRLNMATEAAGVCCWEVDLQERRFLWLENPLPNVIGAHELGYSLDAYRSRMVPEDRAATEATLLSAIENKLDRVSYRYRILGRTGKVVYVQTHAQLRRYPDGNVLMLGVSWDATTEVAAEEQLRDQAQMLRDAERRLERASLSSSEGHWEFDLEHQRVWFSSSYHTLLGYKDGELDSSVAAAERNVHPDDLELLRAEKTRHLETGKVFDVVARLRMKNGEYRWFRHRGMSECNEHGEARSIAGSIQDVHEQKLTEDALRLAQQRFERAINGTQDGLWEIDADGAAWCSPRVAELLGYDPQELASNCNFLKQFLHPDDQQAVAMATSAHFNEEMPYDVEVRLRTRCGDYRWYRARASAERDDAGRPLRLSGSLQDVTDARTAREELLRASEAAEAANRAKGEFLANVSHEIRTPMNGIIGMTGLLLESPLNRTQRDYADTIRSSADSLLIVINDILDFSKIEAGKLDIEALELDLRNTVEEVAVMLAFQAAAKNLELVVHIHPNVPGRVVGDPQRIRQCLINLVSNAIKFTREGEIVIEVSNADLDSGPRRTRFEVRDTGIGIAPETLQNLFQPFVQADSSTTRHFGGTGLGLSIVRRLVQMMGGDVGAHSELKRGSRFWFTLPLAPASQAAPPAPIVLSRAGRRVLVVDDNETNRRVVAGQLMHAGFEVSLAGGGIEAMALLHHAIVDQRPYEVVLADHRMHDMDGATLGERINADPKLSQARLVMLTSVDRHGDIHRFASLGFAAYLTKPIRARELLECIDRVLAHDSKQWHMQSQPIVTRNQLNIHDTRRYSGNVLLVEDNPVNQKVAVRFLERMGCAVRVADNGAEAVRACEDATFDIILMDMQMPVMDGLTATVRIRERETGDGRPNVPIVALTANAMANQLERCMEAGMNDFLTKPLEIPRLHEVLTKFGLRVAGDDAPAPPEEMSELNAPVNLGRLNEITDRDPEFTHELAITFIASGEQALHEARVALAALDRTALSKIAHKLKGASANIHAEPLRALAQTLEAQASSLDQPRLSELVDHLAMELERATEFLNRYAPVPAARAS